MRFVLKVINRVKESYLCNGESEDLVYYVRDDSEVAKLNGINKMEIKKQIKENIKVGDKVVHEDDITWNDVYIVRAIDKGECWATLNNGFNLIDKVEAFLKYQKPIEVGSPVQSKLDLSHTKVVGEVKYIFENHAVVLWEKH